MLTVNIYQDDKIKKQFVKQDSDFCALRYVLNNQGQSCDYALKYGGWKVEIIDEQTGEKNYWKSYTN